MTVHEMLAACTLRQARRLSINPQVSLSSVSLSIPRRVTRSELRAAGHALLQAHSTLRLALVPQADSWAWKDSSDQAFSNCYDFPTFEFLRAHLEETHLRDVPAPWLWLVLTAGKSRSRVDMHVEHLLVDARSLGILASGLSHLLTEPGDIKSLGSSANTHASYARREHDVIQARHIEAQSGWAEVFRTAPGAGLLPSEIWGGRRTSRPEQYDVKVPAELRLRIEEGARRLGISRVLVLLFGLAVAVCRVARLTSVEITLPVDARPTDQRNAVGNYANLVRIPILVRDAQNPWSDLGQARLALATALKFREYPGLLVPRASVYADSAGAPIFFVHNIVDECALAEGVTYIDEDLDRKDEPGLTVMAIEQQSELQVVLEYDSGAPLGDAARRIADEYLGVLQNLPVR